MMSALASALREAVVHAFPQCDIPIELKRPPTEDIDADWSCHVAFKLAGVLKQSPATIAEHICQHVISPHIATCLWTTKGFINITLTPQARWRILDAVHDAGEQYGHRIQEPAPSLMLEFVSANPTGPLHVGHARQAAIGAVLAAVFQSQGWQTWCEFYYNDRGNQIEQLALSVQAHINGIDPQHPAFPPDGYKGLYIQDIAAAFEQHTSTNDDVYAVQTFAVTYLRTEQDRDLKDFGIHFDQYFLESSLYDNQSVNAVIDAWQAHGYLYTQDNALWLRTTAYGDDKDRVCRKSTGEYTYFVPDVAYHAHKYHRQFSRVINIQGSDHQSTVNRVKAGLQALHADIPAHFPEYILHSMVKITNHGEEVKLSKRSGVYVTLRDLLEWIGKDAMRFFMVWRRPNTPFVLDIAAACEQSENNPVFYIQYAHARICSVLKQGDYDPSSPPPNIVLDSPPIAALLRKIEDYPVILNTIIEELSPHVLAHYLLELATLFHRFYGIEKILTAQTTQKIAKMHLVYCVGLVLRSGLTLLGVSAPTAM